MAKQVGLWKFFAVSELPSRPAARTEEQVREQQRGYDAKRRIRQFQRHWQNDYKWLEYNKDQDKMSCTTCSKYESSGNFVSGTSVFKLESVKAHDTSASHKNNTVKLAASNAKPGTSVAEKIIDNLTSANYDKLGKLFRNAHALCVHARPFTDFVWMARLDAKKGVDLGSTYLNDKKAREFTHYIAEAERAIIKDNIKSAKFLALMSDGSTDSSAQEAELVYSRVADKGIITTAFIGIVNIERANSQGIVESLTTAMNQYMEMTPNEWQGKLVGFGCDGASVNLGSKNGVVAQLKKLQPELQGVHCMAHRLELAYRDTLKKKPIYQQVDDLLTGLYVFYKKRPLMRSMLKVSFRAAEKRVLLPTRVGATRWLPHTQTALSNLLQSYGVITTHLSQVMQDKTADAKAKGFAKKYYTLMTRKDIVLFCHLLLDIINTLSKLSQFIQASHVTIGRVMTAVETTRKTLQKYKSKDGPKLTSVADVASGEVDTFDACQLTNARNTDFAASRALLLESLDNTITLRFKDMQRGVVHACSLADFASWPAEDKDSDYGDKDIQLLLASFNHILTRADISVDQVDPEWQLLKEQLYHKKEVPSGTLTWEAVNKSYGTSCPNVLGLIDLILTIPAHSADCERGFSLMKKIKNDWRSRLNDTTVSDVMTIGLHSAPIEDFDPTPAVKLWHTAGAQSKRPGYMRANKEGSGSESDTSDSDEEMDLGSI